MQPAIVSATCPSCGAPLDFSEGSNAIRCQHCESQLLVTGRTQLLSYSIAPSIDAREAARAAMAACEAAGERARVRDATLWLVPYYRMTGHDLRWEWGATERERQDRVDDSEARLVARVMPHWAPVREPELGDMQRKLQLRDRYIEKTFLACTSEGLALPVSLGLRATVLRLELFQPDRCESSVRVVPPSVPPERAWEVGLKAVGADEAVCRRVLRRVLSLVYQPFWAVRMQAAAEILVLVDALNGKVVGRIDTHASVDSPGEQSGPSASIVGFRPLVCPNCGWAFPLKSDEIIAACTSCWRAYAIHGDELRQVDYRLAVVSAGQPEAVTHLPFWVLDASLENDRFHLHIPAFRYRRLKFVVDLARALMSKAPAYPDAGDTQFAGMGAFYDQDDAAALAAFVISATDMTSDRNAKRLRKTPLRVDASKLVWIPYRQERDTLIDPFTSRAFTVSLCG